MKILIFFENSELLITFPHCAGGRKFYEIEPIVAETNGAHPGHSVKKLSKLEYFSNFQGKFESSVNTPGKLARRLKFSE